MLASIFATAVRKTRNVLLLTFFFVAAMGFSSEVERLSEDGAMLAQLTARARQVELMAHLDRARSAAIKKILGIIETYNAGMPGKQKLMVASTIYEMDLKYDNLDVDLICATITHETAFSWNPSVVSPAGALGMMQIMPYVGKILSTNEGLEWTTATEVLFDPVKNIRLGCGYLSSLIELYQMDGGLAAYNGGETRAARWLASGRDDQVLYEETRTYVPAILRLYDIYKN